MNNVTPERKQSVLKSLALAGLLAIIIFIAWVSVQIVSVFPNAVSSLASLADSVYNYEPTEVKDITLTTPVSDIESGETVTIAWNRPQKTGTYAFTFTCSEGVAVEIKTSESTFKDAECNQPYNLGGVDAADIIVVSEKNYQVDFNYTLAYQKTNATGNTTETSQSFTVTNDRLAPGSDEITVNGETITPTTPKPEVTPTTPTPSGTPVTTYEYTYAIPVSNPNGYTDLSVSYRGIGNINNAGIFQNTGIIRQNEAGAIQFTVHNLGTKTSEKWSFEAVLPGGVKFTSPAQEPLKPNERATLTFDFPAINETTLQTFSFEVKVDKDTNAKNDKTTWSTIVLK
jgi:hypothetical protein